MSKDLVVSTAYSSPEDKKINDWTHPLNYWISKSYLSLFNLPETCEHLKVISESLFTRLIFVGDPHTGLRSFTSENTLNRFICRRVQHTKGPLYLDITYRVMVTHFLEDSVLVNISRRVQHTNSIFNYTVPVSDQRLKPRRCDLIFCSFSSEMESAKSPWLNGKETPNL